MAVRHEVPFYRNITSSDRCFQAVVKMVLGYYEPSLHLSWEELDKVTARPKRRWTWPMAGLAWLGRRGYDVINIRDFDHQGFAKDPKNYLFKKFGPRVAAAQIKHSDLAAEARNSRHFLRQVNFKRRQPNRKDIDNYLQNGYLIIVNLNFRALYGLPGYSGHYVLIVGQSGNDFIIHDPGLYLGKANRRVSYGQFSKAWAYPDDSACNLIAVRRPAPA